MADITTEQKIIEYLKQCQGRGATISDFCTAISVQKKSLCKQLRELKRYKVVSEDKKTSPPTWNLSHNQANLPVLPSEANPSSLRERILKHLSQQRAPRTAIEVARGLGLHNKKVVNPILYRLKDDELLEIEGKRGSKPLWRLSEKASAMAEELFRDSSQDSNAPGAYSPEKRHHRYLQRSQSKPYDAAAHTQRRRNASGTGPPAHTAASSSQEPLKQSDSGIVADSGEHGSDAPCEEMTVTVTAKGSREVSLSHDSDRGVGDHDHDPSQSELPQDESVHSVCVESESTHGDRLQDEAMTSEQSPRDPYRCIDDDDKSDFEDYEDDSLCDMSSMSRFHDMMGNLEFSDLTYVEEEGGEMWGGEEASLEPQDIVLLQLSLEPNHTATAAQLARALNRTEEDMALVLGSSGDRVTVVNSQWSLTDRGLAWAREKYAAYPSLAHHLDPSRRSAGQGQVMPLVSSSPEGLLPLNPRQLIAGDPAFRMSHLPAVGVERLSTSPNKLLAGIGRGRKGGGVGGGEEGGCAPGRPVPSSSSPFVPNPPPPSAHLPNPGLPVGSTSSVMSASFPTPYPPVFPHQQSDLVPRPRAAEEGMYGEATPQMGMQSDSVAGGVQAPYPSQEVGRCQPSFVPQSLTSIDPSLQKFAEEGLTVVPASGRLLANHAGNAGFGSLGMTQLMTSVDALGRQMGNTGLAHNSIDGLTDPSVMGGGSYHHGDPALFGDLHRSHSQPQLSSDPVTSASSSAAGGEGPQSMLKITSESFAALNKNPISALMEYAQSRRLQAVIEVVSQRGPSHRPVFLMAARVGSRQFAGVTCSNKKDGRKEAADVALRTLIAEGQYSAAALTPSINVAPEAMTHFDKIAALTHQTFNMLIASIPENLAGRKVIAGLVMKRSEDDVGVVISIGTGNRCITGDKLSLEGNTVNDSHAEIITRRGFMRFLYQQLEKYEPDQPHDLFEAGSGGRLRVKEGISFHLYISTAPCGDGALFSPRDVESNNAELADIERRDHHPTFTSNVQGLLRTKMEGGEGTIPVDTKQETIQTWDGVVRGERLRTMSCTDKICRWNVLGLQGALLSHFVEPIYLDSLTLGFLYDHGHLSRAVCCRLAREEPALDSDLPAGFRLNHPWLGRVTACQPLRETQKTKALSINWTIGDQKAEVLDGTLGHCYTAVEKRLFSRLAKRSLYDSFKAVAQHLGRNDLLQAPTYHHNKRAATAFQAAKAAMVQKFQQLGCGWVKKPVEEEMFS